MIDSKSFELAKEIEALAEKELLEIKQGLPRDIMACRGLLVETVRVLDFIKIEIVAYVMNFHSLS